MLSFLYWYLLITLLGLLALPLTYKLLPGLADRGYTLARTVGLLVWSYLFWLLGSLGLLQNNTAAEVLILIVLSAFSFLTWHFLDKAQFRKWFKQQRRMILVSEGLFLLAFMGWTIIRSANSEIVGTEKPMELAFINAILRSPTLPPHDPWLSGYSISYYYFGYVMVAMLARLTGTLGGVSFNLGVSLIFALTAIGAYGLLYNMLSVWQHKKNSTQDSRSPFTALVGPFFVLIVSNLSGLLQVMRINGVFWRKNEDGDWSSSFWAWLDIGSLSAPPTETVSNYLWWWQGSRIIQDYDYLWNKKESVIDEFPFFSFLLADLHPHLIALPFGFLAMTLALDLLIRGSLGHFRWLRWRLNIDLLSYSFAAFVLGSLCFLNTWDFPFYVALFASVYAIKHLQDKARETAGFKPSLIESAKRFSVMGLSLGVAGGLAFLPFYLGFSSQATGLNPNLIYITKGVYEWIMFAPLLIPIIGLLIYLWRLCGNRKQLIIGIKFSLVLLVILFLVTVILTILLALEEFSVPPPNKSSAFLTSLQAPGYQELIYEGVVRRLHTPGTLLTLIPIVVLVIALLWPRSAAQPENAEFQTPSAAQTFALLLTLLGTALVLIPEFFYLRDFFGYRINTIFKFYFLAWAIWSVVASFGIIVVWREVTGITGAIFKTISISVIMLALLYPVMGLWTRTNAFNPQQWELDGTAHLTRRKPDEAAAIRWLQEAPVGIVAESVGSSYSAHARIATHSGQPSVLGWIGHERQWRGGFAEIGSRENDITRLYCSSNWRETRSILKQYGIRYVVVGDLERRTYVPATRVCEAGLNEAKFSHYLTPVFQQGKINIYETSLMHH